MTKDELARNLGTIARSGTNEFLKRAEEGGASEGNLIGQFGASTQRTVHKLQSDVQVLGSILGALSKQWWKLVGHTG